MSRNGANYFFQNKCIAELSELAKGAREQGCNGSGGSPDAYFKTCLNYIIKISLCPIPRQDIKEEIGSITMLGAFENINMNSNEKKNP